MSVKPHTMEEWANIATESQIQINKLKIKIEGKDEEIHQLNKEIAQLKQISSEWRTQCIKYREFIEKHIAAVSELYDKDINWEKYEKVEVLEHD